MNRQNKNTDSVNTSSEKERENNFSQYPNGQKAAPNSAPKNDNGIGQLPSINLPKGGGAIQGIGEKFSMNPVTGSGTMTVPIATSPGRSGFGPALALNYDSGAGNSVFGLGWNLGIPAITRKTAKGLPKYQDEEESDIFLLSGAEDLIPTLIEEENWKEDVLYKDQYRIKRYRPRTEGLFARIEKWTDVISGEVHWRSISPDNLTSIYGKSSDSRIADPVDPNHIFSWLLEESYDDKGNVMIYEYKQENSEGLEPSLSFEGHRLRFQKSFTNQYIKRIKYGNQKPFEKDQWLFEVIFDYGEHRAKDTIPSYEANQNWKVRKDPFSSYRSGFEIRTYRLCQRVIMFHHFKELGAEPYLVSSTNFTYDEQPHLTKLNAATQTGYLKNENTGIYSQKSLPPVEFGYTEAAIDEEIHSVNPNNLENLPFGLDNALYQWVDLDGEGISGVLTQQGEAWYYKRNLGNAEFAPIERLDFQPSLNASSGQPRIMDIDGDGRSEMVLLGESTSGFYERDVEVETAWQPFQSFESLPNIDWNDPNLRMIDLNGDGFADILMTEDQVYRWYASKANEGFEASESVNIGFDEDYGPNLVFSDTTGSVFLADMSGDGLTDLVRIRNHEICYWPNLGYARFGEKVLMDHCPLFDYEENFDPRRLRLTDVDGSGTIDLIYLHPNGVKIWYNHSGNGWSSPYTLPNFPTIDNLSNISVIDFLGNGTACLVWSSPLPQNGHQTMQYIDLMGGQKPHLLNHMVNNMGAESRFSYVASTKFYLEDKAAGKPWITRLPFPVHVLEKVEIREQVTNFKMVSRYAYHHGYFDGVEREFRGFGMVEQWDTESFSAYNGAGLFTNPPEAVENEFYQPPVLTKTWFHNGAYRLQGKISQHYTQEYYQGDPEAVFLEDTLLPEGLTTQEEIEACRVLRGTMLRQEVYALDGSEKSLHPYSVVEHKSHVKLIQPTKENRYASFYVCNCESLTYHYDRNPSDPRIAHNHTLEIDAKYGMPLKTVAIAYPRRGEEHYEEQMKLHIVYSANEVRHLDQSDVLYRIGIPIQGQTFEITGISPEGAIFLKSELHDAIQTAVNIPYHSVPLGSIVEKRLLEQSRIYYYDNDLKERLPFGAINKWAFPYQSYQLSFTKNHVDQIFAERAEINLSMIEEGGYVNLDGTDQWWTPSGRIIVDSEQFYFPIEAIDPFGVTSHIKYDDYALLPIKTWDVFENTTLSQNDYRVLGPVWVTDPNGNSSKVVHDEMGMVIATAINGKNGEGDMLDNYQYSPYPNQDMRATIWENPHDFLQQATSFFFYDPHAWQRDGTPNYALGIVRETHVSAENGTPSKTQISFSYSDGLGQIAMAKIQAEPGNAPLRDEQGNLLKDENGNLIVNEVTHRWIGNGRTVLDNKGNPIKQYEPFFSSTYDYEDEDELVEWGVTPIMRYDPVGRLIRTELPNGTFSKVAFDPWQQTSYDPNDTVLDSQWYARRISPANTDTSERRAAVLTAKHANTPAQVHLDTLGRPFLGIDHNKKDGADEFIETRTLQDLEGNPLKIIDARGNSVMEYGKTINDQFVSAYTIGGQLLYQNSMDAGERWMFLNVVGNPIHGYDSKGHHTFSTFDALQRPKETYLEIESEGMAYLIQKSLYGESLTNPEAQNLRGQVYQSYDSSGLITNVSFDFKGNLLEAKRQLVALTIPEGQTYSGIVDWADGSSSNVLEEEIFTTLTEYDALNRMTRHYNWHRRPDRVAIYEPIYNERNALVSENHITAAQRTTDGYVGGRRVEAVSNIQYNAKGQRTKMDYGNGTRTRYYYDATTFRLLQLKTTRNTPHGAIPSTPSNLSDPNVLQNLYYTYDPVGNITEIEDDAFEPIFFRNQKVEPKSKYVYDPLYRLIQAEGRENKLNRAPQAKEPDISNISFPIISTNETDKTLRNYKQQYEYDVVGNILRMQHFANGGGWTRNYQYAMHSNRLLATELGSNLDYELYTETPSLEIKYGYDIHGNMLNYNNTLEEFRPQWDYMDRVHQLHLGGGGNAYYQYDGNRQRSRKSVNRQDGTIEERLYLGGMEVYRKWKSNQLVEEIETHHLFVGEERVLMVEDVMQTDNNHLSVDVLDRYQYSNHLGSVGLELDGGASILSYEEYHPYGTVAYKSKNASIQTTGKRYRYTGMERDEESGLNYHGARYYLSWLGRWMSADPIGIEGSLNLYDYVLGRVNNLVDKSGTQPKEGDILPYKIRGRGTKGTGLEQAHTIVEKQLKRLVPGYNRKISDIHNELVRITDKKVHKKVDTAIRKYLKGLKPKDLATREQLFHVVKEIENIWVEVGGVDEWKVKRMMQSTVRTSRKVGGIQKKEKRPRVFRRTLGGQKFPIFTFTKATKIIENVAEKVLKKAIPIVNLIVSVQAVVSKIAEGDYWGAVKEIPLVGDILGSVESAWNWITGGKRVSIVAAIKASANITTIKENEKKVSLVDAIKAASNVPVIKEHENNSATPLDVNRLLRAKNPQPNDCQSITSLCINKVWKPEITTEPSYRDPWNRETRLPGYLP